MEKDTRLVGCQVCPPQPKNWGTQSLTPPPSLELSYIGCALEWCILLPQYCFFFFWKTGTGEKGRKEGFSVGKKSLESRRSPPHRRFCSSLRVLCWKRERTNSCTQSPWRGKLSPLPTLHARSTQVCLERRALLALSNGKAGLLGSRFVHRRHSPCTDVDKRGPSEPFRTLGRTRQLTSGLDHSRLQGGCGGRGGGNKYPTHTHTLFSPHEANKGTEEKAADGATSARRRHVWSQCLEAPQACNRRGRPASTWKACGEESPVAAVLPLPQQPPVKSTVQREVASLLRPQCLSP